MSENVIAEGVVKLSSNAGGLGGSIASALQGLKPHLAQVKADAEGSASGVGGAFTKAGGMVAAGMAVAAVAAIGFALKSADTFKTLGTEVIKVQRYFGGTTEEASKWRFVAQQSGVDTDVLTRAVGKLSTGLETGKVNLGKFGIASFDAHGKVLPMNDVLLNIATKMAALPPGFERSALAAQIFGQKAGPALVPLLQKGREGILALEQEATKYGLVLSGSNLAAIKANIAAHREQTAAMQGLQVQIGQNVLPVLTKLTTAFTEGLVKVMPLVTSIMNGAVVPAFSAFASVVSGSTSFISSHIGLIKILAGVVGAALVPALVAWAVAQGIVLAQNMANFLLGIASTAVRAASSIGLMTGSLEGGTVAFTAMNAASAASMAGITVGAALAINGILGIERSADRAAQALTRSAGSPQAALDAQVAKLKELQVELSKQGDLAGLWGVRLFSGTGKILSGIQSTKSQIATLTKQLADVGDATTQAGNAIADSFTTSGLAIASLGGATQLTSDQIQELADHLNLDLSKATPAMTAKLVDAARQLGYTSEATSRLGTDTGVLSSWMSTVAERTKAFKDGLDALVGTQVSAEQTSIAFHQALDDTIAKLKGVKYSTDITTQAGRDQQSQIDTLVTATQKMIESDQNSGLTLDLLRPKIAAHVADLDGALRKAGLTTAQIDALNIQYNLTPAALAQVTPAIDGQTTAWNNLSGAIGGTGLALAALVAAAKVDVGPITASAAAINAATNTRGVNTGAAAALAASGGSSGLIHRAGGGDSPAGVPTLVGEEGPEIRTFDRSGSILSHGQSNSVLGMMLAASRPTSTVTHNHYQMILQVAGSVISETQLLEKARVYGNRYNSRAGVGR